MAKLLAENGDGLLTESSLSIGIELEIAPSITDHPDSVDIAIGLTQSNSASFSVSATGNSLTYQWQVDTGGGFSNLLNETAATLNLTNLELADDGNLYRCIVSNGSGSVTTNSATLTTHRVNPAELGAVWWIEADQEVYQDTDDPIQDGETVRIWADLIGSADLTQITTGSRPTYDATVGPGNQSAIIGASSKSMANTSTIATTYTLTLCAYHISNIDGASNCVMRWHNGTQYMLFQDYNVNGTPSLFNGGHHQFPNGIDADTNYLLTTTRNAADEAHTGRINGSTNSISFTLGGIGTLFSPREVFTTSFGSLVGGGIYGGAVYDSILTGDTLTDAEAYWAAKYGIILS